MKQFYLSVALFLFSFQAISQTNFVIGSLVNLNGDTIRGQINDELWIANPETFDFKSTDGSVKKYLPADLKAFIVGDRMYRSYLVSYDSTSSKLDALSSSPLPSYKVYHLLLKVLIDSKKSLLEYIGKDDRIHFFIEFNGNVEELVNHPFLFSIAGTQSIQENRLYLARLQKHFADCENLKVNTIISYSRNALKKLFKEYNLCIGKTMVYDLDNTVKSKFGWGFVSNVAYEGYRKGFAKNLGYGLGVFLSWSPSHRQYKTSYFTEITFHKFPDQRKDIVVLGGLGIYSETFKTNSMKVILAMRTRFGNSKNFFFSTGVSLSFGLKDEYRHVYSNTSIQFGNIFWPMGGLFLGLGTWVGSTAVEFRYERGSGVSFGLNQKTDIATSATGFSSVQLAVSIKVK